MPSRPLNTQTPRPRIQPPERRQEWQRLMQLVIHRAELLGDRRLSGLRRALADGEAELTLRRLGIIHQGDIQREFPDALRKT